jgi:hypothetical protein
VPSEKAGQAGTRDRAQSKLGARLCQLPLSTAAPTFYQLVARVLEIVPNIAAANGLAAPGNEIEVHVIAECVQSVQWWPRCECPRLFALSCSACYSAYSASKEITESS